MNTTTALSPSAPAHATPGYERVKHTALRYVASMKIGEKPGRYAKERGEGESLYGSYHAAHILDLFGELHRMPAADLDAWADFFRAKQADAGFFANDPALLHTALDPAGLNRVWHWTRGCLWAFRILGRTPSRPLAFLDPLARPDALRRWVLGYDWSQPWAASNQVLGLATAMLARRDWFGETGVDACLREGLYPALESLLDPRTGVWGTQFGADLANGIFANIHLLPIYFALGWPVSQLERMVDATLAIQLPDGSYWPGGSDCPDFDGAYMLANLHALTDHRREEVEAAARRYLVHALQHEDEQGWRLHRKDTLEHGWKPRPHWQWPAGAARAVAEQRDEDPKRTHIMLGSWFYPLSIGLVAHLLGDTGYEGPYRVNGHSLHQCNVFNGTRTLELCRPADT